MPDEEHSNRRKCRLRWIPAAAQLPVTELAYYVSSRTKDELDDADMLDAIVGHWDALENGTHRVRDVSIGEDACRGANPKATRNIVTLRNLAIGLYNLLRFQKKIRSSSLPNSRSLPVRIKNR